MESLEPKETEPKSSGGGGGGSSPQSEIRDPYGKGNMPNQYRGYQGTAVAAEAPKAGGMRYQPLTMGGAPAPAAAPPAVASVAPPAAAPAAAESSGSGLSWALAAASPFVALLGKAVKKQRDGGDED